MDDAIEWPAEIAWVFEVLQRTPRPQFRRTPMEAGERARRTGTDIPTLEGEVVLDGAQWSAVQALAAGRANLFTSGAWLVSFMAAPALRETKLTFGPRDQPARYRVHLQLRVHKRAS